MSGPVEPTPASGDDIPESVLRELQTVFADPDDDAPAEPSSRDTDAGGAERVAGSGPTGSDAGSGGRRIVIVDDALGLPGALPPIEPGADPGSVPAAAAPRGRDARRQRRRDRRAVKAATKEVRKATRKATRATADGGGGHLGAEGAAAGLAASSGTPAVSEGGDHTRAVKTIVIGGNDELPDALYLDDVATERLRDVHGAERARDVHGAVRSRDVHGAATGARAGGSTIVIGDELDSSGAFDAVPVPTRSMDPRVRARRIAVKRAAGRRRLVWVGAVVLVVVLAVGTLAVFSSSLFAVEQIRIQGAPYTQLYDTPRLQAVVDSLDGEPILLVDTLAAERRLEQIPWIERAIVTTDFPHGVLIDVRERQPLAAFQGSIDGKYRIVDRDGRVLDVLDGRPADYMLVTGQAPDVERGALAGAPWAAAAQMVAALPAEIREITTSVSVDAGTGDLGLVLQPAIDVRLGGFAGLDAKLARLLQLVRDGLLGIISIDVSTAEVSVTRG